MNGTEEEGTILKPAAYPVENDYEAYIKMYGTPPPPGWRPNHEVPHDFDRPEWMRQKGTGAMNASVETIPSVSKVRKRYKRGLVASILILVPIIVLALALFTRGWYSIESETGAERNDFPIETKDIFGYEHTVVIEHFSVNMNWNMEYGLFLMKGENHMIVHARDSSIELDEKQEDDFGGDNYRLEEEKEEAILTLIGGFLTIAVMIAFIPLGILAYFNKVPGFIPLAIAIMAALQLILAMVFFTVSFPGEVEKDQKLFDEVTSEDSGLGSEYDSLLQESFEGAFEGGSFGWSYYLTWATVPLIIGIGCMFIGVKKEGRWVSMQILEEDSFPITTQQESEPKPMGEGIRYHYRV